jgi:hypothetical protein
MKVLCIDGITGYTILGKVYDVIKETPDMYYVRGEHAGNNLIGGSGILKHRFKIYSYEIELITFAKAMKAAVEKHFSNPEVFEGWEAICDVLTDEKDVL